MTQFVSGSSQLSQAVREALSVLQAPLQENGCDAFLFGGVPRELWMEDEIRQVRDLDVVVDDVAFPLVVQQIGSQGRVNRFGGLKCNLNGLAVDVWSLSSTWAFRLGVIKEVSFAALPRTTFLNLDSIVVELFPRPNCDRRYYECGFFQALRTRVLDIQLDQNPFPLLSAVRALQCVEMLHFRLSQRLGNYILKAVLGSSFADVEKIQKDRYSRVLYSATAVMKLAEKLQLKLAGRSTAPIDLFNDKDQAELWAEDVLPIEVFDFQQLAGRLSRHAVENKKLSSHWKIR